VHIFLSPHFDDAVFSCGSHIADLVRAGESVLIFTVMAAPAPPDFKPSFLTRRFHNRWKVNGDTVTTIRRDEDSAAARMLGAQVAFGPFADSPYRLNPRTKKPLYPSFRSLKGAIQADDAAAQLSNPSTIDRFLTVLGAKPGDTLYAPLAVGKHVDHQVVRNMGRALATHFPQYSTRFYEDYPYIVKGAHEIPQIIAGLGFRTVRVVNKVSDAAVEAKIAAIACYKSQLTSFWRDTEHMQHEMHSYMARYGEAEWQASQAALQPLPML